MKAVVAAFNQEKALVGAFSVITNRRMELFEALPVPHTAQAAQPEFVLELELQTRLPLADDEVLCGLPLGGRVADHLQCGHMLLIHVFFMTFINCDA